MPPLQNLRVREGKSTECRTRRRPHGSYAHEAGQAHAGLFPHLLLRDCISFLFFVFVFIFEHFLVQGKITWKVQRFSTNPRPPLALAFPGASTSGPRVLLGAEVDAGFAVTLVTSFR